MKTKISIKLLVDYYTLVVTYAIIPVKCYIVTIILPRIPAINSGTGRYHTPYEIFPANGGYLPFLPPLNRQGIMADTAVTLKSDYSTPLCICDTMTLSLMPIVPRTHFRQWEDYMAVACSFQRLPKYK